MATSVLVVDDDPSFRVAVTTLLRTRGFVVAGYAVDEQQIMAFLARHNPDAILLDVSHEGSDGLRALKALREMDWQGPVLLTSSSAEAITSSVAIELGAVGFVPKEDLMEADLAAYFTAGAGQG